MENCDTIRKSEDGGLRGVSWSVGRLTERPPASSTTRLCSESSWGIFFLPARHIDSLALRWRKYRAAEDWMATMPAILVQHRIPGLDPERRRNTGFNSGGLSNGLSATRSLVVLETTVIIHRFAQPAIGLAGGGRCGPTEGCCGSGEGAARTIMNEKGVGRAENGRDGALVAV